MIDLRDCSIARTRGEFWLEMWLVAWHVCWTRGEQEMTFWVGGRGRCWGLKFSFWRIRRRGVWTRPEDL